MVMTQKEKFTRLLDEEDEFLIVVLDACRYDALRDYFAVKDIPGEVEKTRSLGINAQTWVKNTWNERYDVVYVSGVPFIGDRETKDYDGNKHFRDVVNTWSHGWSDGLGTVLPFYIVDDVKFLDFPRIIAHFVQPHAPHARVLHDRFR